MSSELQIISRAYNWFIGYRLQTLNTGTMMSQLNCSNKSLHLAVELNHKVEELKQSLKDDYAEHKQRIETAHTIEETKS